MSDLAHAIWTLRNDVRERMASRTSMAAVVANRFASHAVRTMDVNMIRSCIDAIRVLAKSSEPARVEYRRLRKESDVGYVTLPDPDCESIADRCWFVRCVKP